MQPSRYATVLRSRLCLAAVLAIPALVMATQLYAGYRLGGVPVSFAAALAIQLCHWELWTVAGPIVWSLERRWPITPPRYKPVLRHLAAAVVIAVAVLLVNLALYHGLIRLPGTSSWFAGFDRSVAATAVFYFASLFHVEILVYCGIIVTAHGARTSAQLRATEHEALRLEAELAGATLKALRTQLQPHFLFNALHTVGSLVVQRQNERAVQLLAELGELLRTTLSSRDTELAPLADEMTYLRKYVQIEEARFGDRLRVDWDIAAAAEPALVPPFILQPIVENAFRHGIARQTEQSTLRVAATVGTGRLLIVVSNDGPQLPEGFSLEQTSGYGLKNVSERLRAKRPGGRLALANTATGVRVTLELPLWDAEAGRAPR